MTAEQLNGLNRKLIEAMIADGFAMVSSTVLRGNTVCTINPRTTEDDLRATIKRLDEIGKKWRPL
jgi:hypothetical protein